MDGIFGEKNFRNQIIWQRSSRSDGKKFGNVADHILFYSKTDNYTWNDQFTPLTAESLADLKDKKVNLTGAGITGGESGQTWKDHNPSDYGRHWSVPLTGKFAEWWRSIAFQTIAKYKEFLQDWRL